jgi:Fe-Mn family superoxide dismutase
MSSHEKETVGNFELTKQGVITRREVLMMGAVAATSLSTVNSVIAANTGSSASAAPAAAAPKGPYSAKDFSGLVSKNMEGLSSSQIEQHLKLYKGYVTKSNEIYEQLKSADLANPNATYSPLRELLLEQSFAVNGMVYHEFYFGNLGGTGGDPSGDVKAALDERYGSTGKFMDFLKASGKCMRGWVVVGYNTRGGHIDTFGLDMHNMWSPQNVVPLLVLDVYEHAYMVDYGIDRAKYLDAFAKNLDWQVVGKRLAAVKKLATGPDTTV